MINEIKVNSVWIWTTDPRELCLVDEIKLGEIHSMALDEHTREVIPDSGEWVGKMRWLKYARPLEEEDECEIPL